MTPKTITLLTHGDLDIQASVWEAPQPKQTILYLHGGGLIFGQRDDLPTAYIDKLTQAGYTLIALDYLLAPETKLNQILSTLKLTINELSVYYDLSTVTLMGRSAGAYLGYLLLRDGLVADHFIDLYGYYTLANSQFTMPTPFYSQFPQVLPMDAQAMVQSQPLVQADLDARYPIYISGRQFGTWFSQFLPDASQTDVYSLTTDQLAKLPKTLLLHCTNDPDVPYEIAEQAHQQMPQSTLISIDKAEHDFDRTVTDETLAYYDQIVTFIASAD